MQQNTVIQKLLEESDKINQAIVALETAVYMIAKENDGVLQIVDKTSNTDKNIVTLEAQKLAKDNSHDYLVLKIVSKHKRIVTTKDIIYG